MNNPQNLRELVEAAILKHSTSGRQLAFLAQKEGFTLATTTVNAIRQGTYKSAPTDETIRAIAWLAGVSDEVAFMAAGQSVPGPPFAEELPPGVDNLPPKARKAAIDMLRVLVDMNKDANELQEHMELVQAERNVLAHGVHPGSGKAGQRSNAGTGQKTKRLSAVPSKTTANTSNGHSEHDRSAPNVQRIAASDYEDNSIPLPEDYLELAAHPATDSTGRREHEAGRERGEESQDQEID